MQYPLKIIKRFCLHGAMRKWKIKASGGVSVFVFPELCNSSNWLLLSKQDKRPLHLLKICHIHTPPDSNLSCGGMHARRTNARVLVSLPIQNGTEERFIVLTVVLKPKHVARQWCKGSSSNMQYWCLLQEHYRNQQKIALFQVVV